MTAYKNEIKESLSIKNGKPTYSPSRLALYARCPRMFSLAEDYKPVFTKSQLDSFRDGNLFEGYTFGFKSKKPDRSQKALEGRKKPETLQTLKDYAKMIKPIFKNPRKGPFRWMEHELENIIIHGEADYIGLIDTEVLAELVLDVNLMEKIPSKVIVDLKFTGDISKTWDFRGSEKQDYLQSAFYPYLHCKNTGELLPFIYLIVEGFYKRPVIRCIYLEIHPQVMDWVEDLVQKVNNDLVFKPFASKATCVGGYRQSRCSYMDVCEHGRQVLGGLRTASFMDLGETFFFNYENKDNA